MIHFQWQLTDLDISLYSQNYLTANEDNYHDAPVKQTC